MPSSSVNQLAKTNGDFGEHLAPMLMDKVLTPELKIKIGDVEFVDELIDFYSETGIPIEVKTCQETINRGDGVNKNRRLGRFLLDKDQHDFLLHKQGYYLFIVKAGSLVMKAKIMRADDITFQRQIIWRPLWS